MKNILSADLSGGVSAQTKAVLRQMGDDGDDLSQSREIEFNHFFEEEEDAIAFIEAAGKEGFARAACDFWDEHVMWQSAVQIHMIPDARRLDAIVSKLDEIARNFRGRPDGWGCVEVVAEVP